MYVPLKKEKDVENFSNISLLWSLSLPCEVLLFHNKTYLNTNISTVVKRENMSLSIPDKGFHSTATFFP